MAELGVILDHAPPNHWLAKSLPLIENSAQRLKAPADALSGHFSAMPCRITDETYLKVKGEWVYLYRAVDKLGKTLDFMLSKRRNMTVGIKGVNRMLRNFGCPIAIEMVRIKDLINMAEQDHRSIKKRIGQMLDFKSFDSASATLEGIKVANRTRKGQMMPGLCPFAHSATLAA